MIFNHSYHQMYYEGSKQNIWRVKMMSEMKYKVTIHTKYNFKMSKHITIHYSL